MKNHTFSESRRKFIRKTGTAVAAAPFILRYNGIMPNSKLSHACIGVGGMIGGYDLDNFMKHPSVQIVALCDVDSENLKKASKLLPDARLYSDWREMLIKEKNSIDSVNVAIPDHNHFPAAMSALKAGKHVYCQKPMCHELSEVRALTGQASSSGLVTQLGTQVASARGERIAVQLLREGAIGKIKHVYMCSNRPGAEIYRLEGPHPVQGQQPPSTLDWDLWIGSAPMRPYVPEIYHPVKWRAWQDFGTGWIGDIGCHIFNVTWKGLGLRAPESVHAEVQKSWQSSTTRNKSSWPQSEHITWIFPGNEKTAEDKLTIEWFDGEFFPPREIRDMYKEKEYPYESAMLIGTEGAMLIPHQGFPVLMPKQKFESYKIPEFEDRNHYHHFADACMGGEMTDSNFSVTGPMTETILLASVALRVPDKVLRWDSKKMKFPESPEANKLLSRKYRKGWDV